MIGENVLVSVCNTTCW